MNACLDANFVARIADNDPTNNTVSAGRYLLHGKCASADRPVRSHRPNKWLLFSPDDQNTPPTPKTRQIDALVDKLADRTYLEGV
ncbi:hypothetical protein F4859DRAFT_518490 [Xylaria cf. heliscus]|nr:hypothetical protein F4859DRAFT_518490 [Xylaria cf. heliscus]